MIADPFGHITYSTEVNIPQGNEILVVTKIDLPQPLIPGRWKAKIAYQDSLVAESSFLVIPEIYSKRRYVGLGTLAIDFNLVEQTLATPSKYAEFTTSADKFYTNVEELKSLWSFSSDKLIEYINKQVMDFWNPAGACKVDNMKQCNSLALCNETNWSSHSPDPKSDIGAIDHKTGKIRQFT